jgi:lantibiotic leader peptide-processing serine protease
MRNKKLYFLQNKRSYNALSQFKQNLYLTQNFLKMIKTCKPILMLGLTVITFANCNKEQVSSDLAQTSYPNPMTQGFVVAPTYYLLEGNRVNSHTAQIRQKLTDLGAIETAYMPDFKFMAVTSAHPNFRTELEALNVNVDIDLAIAKPSSSTRTRTTSVSNASSNPDFGIQWNLQAISAPAAWALGYKGQGVRVAVIDDGFFLNHPDLAANMNQTLGRNFVQLPGENPLDVTPYNVTGFSHGSHVSGIIAAVDNSIGIVGVAPQAEILPIKVFGPNYESHVSWTAQAIVYAANQGAKVINLSLGGIINKSAGGQIWMGLYHQAIQYATAQGATVICAAGNDAIDFDHNGSVETFPAGSPQALCISATSPLNWSLGSTGNLDIPTSYTNFGTSRIDFAAPGGDLRPLGSDYDLVLSTGYNADYNFAGGTSQAAPHVAGVAALLIGKNGGSMPPAQVKTKLRQSADDLGIPGKDAYFGHGRINALNTVQ